jgi:glycosyltransferase involved in cell wall biosynthesis
MRIAVVTWSEARVGGTETYVEEVIRGLVTAGHAVAFCHECDAAKDQSRIALPADVPAWSVQRLGRERLLACLREWRPEVHYLHVLFDTHLEARLQEAAPTVLYAHNYYGTCISGSKTWTRPNVVPCTRQFGWGCLAHFFPHGCGGRNPLTMWRQFRRERQRHELLDGYRAVLVASRHMREEFIRNGLAADRVVLVPLPLRDDIAPPAEQACQMIQARLDRLGKRDQSARLLFLGRLEWNKGCRYALDALPLIARALNRPVELTVAGEGSARPELERRCQTLTHHRPAIRVSFTGWVGRERLPELFTNADLLLVPSLWPEPFGLVGLEAALFGVPAAAFAVGGIPDWLTEGETGALASGYPPTVEGLAKAALRCLSDPARLGDLSRRGLQHADSWPTLTDHIHHVHSVCSRAIGIHEPMV